MPNGWNSTTVVTEEDALRILTDLRGRRWLLRGQTQHYNGLLPSIDRGSRAGLSRADKLTLERRSIDLFRSTARVFADRGEEGALTDDIVTLMVLRHYGVATRLLDWSSSPWVAAYFAAAGDDTVNGEIWAFDEPLYEQVGAKQWDPWAGVFPAWTAFSLDEPTHWFVCRFYRDGFPRQNAQQSAYTMTPGFGIDHAKAIAQLFVDYPDHYHLYIVPAELKQGLRQVLREMHGIWRGSLYPDSAGAAGIVRETIPQMRV